MEKSEASIANRVLLFCFVAFLGGFIWVYAIGSITETTGISGNLKIWLTLTFGSAIITDRIYVKMLGK